MQAKNVAFGVHEPRCLFGAEHAHIFDGLEAGKVVVLEHDADGLQLGMLATMFATLKLTAVWSAFVPPSFGNSASVAPEQS